MTLAAKTVAIITDIHSNLTALEAVTADAERRGAAEFWCIGDLVGYGPDPNECVSLIENKASRCIIGSHDLGVLGRESLDLFNPYAAANRWTRGVLNQNTRTFLESLAPMAAWEDVTFAHGSPRESVWEYVMNGPIAHVSFPHFQTRLYFLGHSHVPPILPGAQTPLRIRPLPVPKRPPTGCCQGQMDHQSRKRGTAAGPRPPGPAISCSTLPFRRSNTSACHMASRRPSTVCVRKACPNTSWSGSAKAPKMPCVCFRAKGPASRRSPPG